MQKVRSLAGTAAAVLALATLAGLAAASPSPGRGAGAAQYQYPPSAHQYGKKLVVCHKGRKTLRVGKPAWRAHRRHGDSLGRCSRRDPGHARPAGKGHRKTRAEARARP